MLFAVLREVGVPGLLVLATLLCGIMVEARPFETPLEVTIYTRRLESGQWQAEVEVTHGTSISDLMVSHLTKDIKGDQPTVYSKTTISASNTTILRLYCPALVSSTVDFKCQDETPCSGPQLVGTKVTLACKDGHVTQGVFPSDITCQSGGSWSGVVSSCKKVPDEYEFFPGLGWYRLYEVGNTFEQAQRICKYDGGELGVIDMLGEVEAVRSLANRSRTPIKSEHQHDVYVGVLKQDGEYISPTGKPMSASYYFRWCQGRPPPGPPNGDCSILATQDTLFCHWDSSCNRKIRFLCEIPLKSS